MYKLTLIFIGGGLGSLARFGLSYMMPYQPDKFPWATFCANLWACFFLGILLHYVSERQLADSLRWLLVVGFCGGFSTFSTFSGESWQMWRVGDWTLWSIYAISSVIGGIVVLLAGIKLMAYIHTDM